MLKSILFSFFLLISSHCFSQYFIDNTDSSKIDEPPIFPQGGNAFVRKLTISFRIPESVIKSSFQGDFVIHFTVDTVGITNLDSINFDQMAFHRKIVLPRAKTQVKEDITKEVLRIFERMPEWVPGISKGISVPVRYKLPFQILFEEPLKW